MPGRGQGLVEAMAKSGMNSSSPCGAIDTGYEGRVLGHFRRQAFLRFIGAEPVRVLHGFCALQMKNRDDLACGSKGFHPGAMAALAVGAGECAALTLLPPDATLTFMEDKLSLLAPAEGDVLIANAKVIKSSATMTVCMAEMYACRDQSRNLCAVSLMTFVPG